MTRVGWSILIDTIAQGEDNGPQPPSSVWEYGLAIGFLTIVLGFTWRLWSSSEKTGTKKDELIDSLREELKESNNTNKESLPVLVRAMESMERSERRDEERDRELRRIVEDLVLVARELRYQRGGSGDRG